MNRDGEANGAVFAWHQDQVREKFRGGSAKSAGDLTPLDSHVHVCSDSLRTHCLIFNCGGQRLTDSCRPPPPLQGLLATANAGFPNRDRLPGLERSEQGERLLARGARVAQGKETPSPSAFAGGERRWVREEGGRNRVAADGVCGLGTRRESQGLWLMLVTNTEPLYIMTTVGDKLLCILAGIARQILKYAAQTPTL